MSSLHPGLVLIAGAVFLPFLRGRLRSFWMLLLPVVGLVSLLGLEHGEHWRCQAFGQELVLLRVDKLSALFSAVFLLASFLGNLFALHEKRLPQQISALVYAGSAVGAALGGDLVTLFLFWEVIGIAPVFLVVARGTGAAYGAGLRYAMMQVLSGILLLVGIALHAEAVGSTSFTAMTLDGPGPWLIFLAFGIKCGWPLLHGWITDAYPESTASGPVFLSAFTTKIAVYALARGFPGTEALVWIGMAMAVFPIFYAVIENDLRRVLCYSMINQVGFMVCGIGIGTELALNGAVAHAFCDIVFKGLLFMSMGAVFFRTGRMNGTDLGGLHRTMPWTAGFCMVGAASISAFPLFSAFVSKSMIMAAAASEGYPAVWAALLFASAGVFHHAGIKIPFFAFFAHDSGLRPQEAPRHMLAAMGIAAALCIGIGVFPGPLYSALPYAVDYQPYTVTHVITQLQLLFWSALAFCVLKLTGIYPPEIRGVNLDADGLYRKGGRSFTRAVAGPLMDLFGVFGRFAHERVPHALDYFARNPAGAMRLGLERTRLAATSLLGRRDAIRRAHDRYDGLVARYEKTRPGVAWPVGQVVLYVVLALLVFLLVYLAR
jgi:multicomponent Na+:H+ antiporter subunit D